MLEIETCTQAFHNRGAQFDGVFFIAVKTTKVYCCPVCKVKQPLDKNVTFLPRAKMLVIALALGAGPRQPRSPLLGTEPRQPFKEPRN